MKKILMFYSVRRLPAHPVPRMSDDPVQQDHGSAVRGGRAEGRVRKTACQIISITNHLITDNYGRKTFCSESGPRIYKS